MNLFERRVETITPRGTGAVRRALRTSPFDEELTQGISVYFTHASLSNEDIYTQLQPHIQPHEALEQRDNLLFFKRC